MAGQINLINQIEKTCSMDKAGHCITCSDEALPVKILELDLINATALVVMGDETLEIDVSLVEDVAPGDWLLIHGGVALSRLETEER